MSQSHNSTDSQALLQSMLQRLKLQPGREGQPFLHTPVSITAESSPKEDGEMGVSNLHRINSSPASGLGFGTNGIPSREFGISAVESNFGLKAGDAQLPGRVGSFASFSPQKDNMGNDLGENSVFKHDISPEITPTGTRQLFPAVSLKVGDSTSFERPDGKGLGFDSSSMRTHFPGHNNPVPSLAQDCYLRSMKPRDANLDQDSQEKTAPNVGNIGFETLAQSKDLQFFTNSQKTANSSSKRKQRSSESKTRRWTQKIKERWLERSGSVGKKGKRSEQETESSPQNQLQTAENLNTSNREEERIQLSSDISDHHSKPVPSHTEENTLEGHVRSSGDFEFGLGSFSLLEEIITGQEWGRFLNPNLTATSADQRPSEELSLLKIQENHLWSYRGTESFPPVGMDVPVGQQQCVHRAADLSEPNFSAFQKQQHESVSPVEPTNCLDHSKLKLKGPLNRKRQHQSAGRRREMLQTGEIMGTTSSLSMTSSHVTDDTGESQHDAVFPLYGPNSSTPLTPSAFNPSALSPRSVLKNSVSQDSEGTVTKRRRVEENRRVHFSEDVVAIDAPALDMDLTDSEEDSEADEDSVIEEECGEEQAMVEEVAPGRRPILPAWIQALKRKNISRKHR
ncbi:uncharacterized protein LOC115050190 [Echeneis naucrates]|uniref:uncharacterized protein LOC115050190 n=1 Tax=Echeneis naucrates TaxID=173247 RepID=UPI001113C383|nr:uncharacterized protein LOC115050190 [Echeneis naucrates]